MSEGSRDRFSRVISIGMVLVTLAAALVGYLLNDASKSGDQAAARAQRLSLQAMGSVFRGQQRAQVAVETFVLAEQQRLRSAEVRQRRLFATDADTSALDREETRWRRIAERTQELTPLNSESAFGPGRDANFPTKWYVAHQQEAIRLGAVQDAANEQSSVWGSRFASYTAILTMFAVALYLLGFSLTLPRAARRLFFTMGVLLSVTGCAWAAALVLAEPDRAPDQAAEEYARGDVLSRTAYAPADYRAAISHFDRAIALRPSFAQAYVDRAEAEFAAGSPPGAFEVLADTPSLERATDDLRRALALGADNGLVLGNLGFNEFLVAVRERRPGLLGDAERHTRRAIELSPSFVNFAYNLGLVLLAERRPEAARAAYERAILRTIYRDVATKKKRLDEQFEEETVAGALTDLQNLVTEQPELADEVRAAKQLIVGSVSRRRLAAPASRARLGKPVADVFAGEVQVRALRFTRFDFDHDTLSMQWYAAGPHGLGWVALPEVSGTVFVDPEGYGPGDLELDEDDTYFVLRRYLEFTYPPRCFTRGRYRVELYVNGRLVSQAAVQTSFGRLDAGVARTLDIRVCRPPSWEHSDLTLAGLMEGFVSDDGSRGVYAFRVGKPRSLEKLPAAKLSPAVLQRLVKRFSFIFPSEPSFVEPDEESYFLGLDGSVTYRYAYTGGKVLAGAGVAEDGTVVVGLVFAPEKDWDGDLPYDVFDSMVLIE